MTPLTRRALAALFSCAVAVPAAHAQFNLTGFPNANNLTLLRDASVNGGVAGGALRITRALGDQIGGAYFSTRQIIQDGFTTTFTFSVSGAANGGADGFAFVIYAGPTPAISGNDGGCEIGYHELPNCVAVEFDTWYSDGCSAGLVADPNDNHISIHTRGTLPNSAQESVSVASTTAIANISSGQTHTCRITYTGGIFSVYLNDLVTPVLSTPLDLAATLALDQGRAWVGFTGATGGAIENHDILSWSLSTGGGGRAGDDRRPATPRITEPALPGQVLNPSDVHMVTVEQVSPVGSAHLCSDWELWTVQPLERVWTATCAAGALAVHVHLGDGAFIGTHAGRTTCQFDTNYVLRARHRDSSGDQLSQYSRWAVQPFRTGSPATIFPLELDDILTRPAPQWRTDSAPPSPVTLPSGAALTLASQSGDLLLHIQGTPAGNVSTDGDQLLAHVPVLVSIAAGATPLTLAPSSLAFVNHDCVPISIFLPALALPANQTARFWVATSGSTYFATNTQTAPTFDNLARGTLSPWEPRQPGFVVEPFASGLQLPVNIAFLNNPGTNPTDPFFYVTELYGQVMMVTRSGALSVYAGNLLNFNPTGAFPGSGEVGLAGVVVEPVTGDLFVTLLFAINGDANQLRPRIVRLHSNDGGRTVATQTLIRDFPNEPQGQSHQISNITFGPDGKLYVHMGDGFNPANAQNLDSARGKILRMNLDGSAPTDNPFYNAADGLTARDLVWVYGIRNPFGGAWRASDAHHYTVENGPSVDRLFLAVPGRNYLYDGSDDSMRNFALYNWDPAHAPVTITFVESATFNGSGFPASKLNHAFVAESGPTYATGPQTQGKRIVEFEISPTGALISGPTTFVEYTGSGQATAVGVTAGPDGLYFTDLYKDLGASSPIERGANVYRIRSLAGGAACGCPVDFNNDGTLNPDDLADYIGSYFSVPPGLGSDFNNDGTTDPDDLADFISAFFNPPAGC